LKIKGRKEQEMNSQITTKNDSTLSDLVKILFAVLLPPLGVALEVGITKQFWINVLLTIFGFLPGIIHAVYVIAKR
jgi:uncharacterized membrane protein YqaE (UPF0057 family)